MTLVDEGIDDIDLDASADLIGISAITGTAPRAYELADHYRRRGIPVVMGGFHTTLVPDEVRDYAEAFVVGEAEGVWSQVIEDVQRGRLQRVYSQPGRPPFHNLKLDRSIFAGKRSMPIGLVEAGRGCKFRGEFCAIQSYFGSTQTRRPTDEIVKEVRRVAQQRKLIFFVDDNIISNMAQARNSSAR